MLIKQEILLVSPVLAIQTLVRLMGTSAFYRSILGTFGRILLGFALALSVGTLLAALAARWRPVRILLHPPIAVINATPIASFAILALILIGSKNLSVFISFLMVLPVIYLNVLNGIESADAKLIEMANAFKVSRLRQLGAIYAPAAVPYLLAACQVALGMCWKSGIAAEVIGQPPFSIGTALYQTKIFLATDELFAWTLAVILISAGVERLALLGLNRLGARVEGGSP